MQPKLDFSLRIMAVGAKRPSDPSRLATYPKTKLRPRGFGARQLLAFVVALTGCAGASVAPRLNSQPASNDRPSTIYVYPFSVSTQDVTLNQGFFQRTYRDVTDENQSQSQLQVAQQAAQDLTRAMVQQLQGLGFTANQVARGQQVSGNNALVVDGEFTDINEGNKLRRMVVGFGLGQSSLDTQVHVYQLAGGMTQQIMDFTTHADSGSMPGAVIGAPGAAAGGAAAAASLGVNVASAGVKSVTSATGYLTNKTANQAVAYMSQYFGSQGWIPQSMVKDPKLAASGD